MIRKQVYIDERQDRELKRLAASAGLPAADLIREGIDMMLEKRRAATDWRQLLDASFGIWKDQDDISERFAKNKAEQRRLWSERLERNRKQLETS